MGSQRKLSKTQVPYTYLEKSLTTVLLSRNTITFLLYDTTGTIGVDSTLHSPLLNICEHLNIY